MLVCIADILYLDYTNNNYSHIRAIKVLLYIAICMYSTIQYKCLTLNVN